MSTADFGFLPVILVWVVAIVVSRVQKAKKEQEREASQRARDPGAGTLRLNDPPPEPARAEPTAQLGMMAELRRAMEELKRAEMQTRAHEQADEMPSHVSATPSHVSGTPVRRDPRPTADTDARAHRYLESRLRVDRPQALTPDTTRHPIYREHAVVPDASAPEGVEEGTDYDLESLRAADARKRAQGVRGQGQGTAELSIADTADAPVVLRRPLAKYADGTPRSALIASLIMGRPLCEQPPDA